MNNTINEMLCIAYIGGLILSICLMVWFVRDNQSIEVKEILELEKEEE